jgi:lysophospholipase L1-like esterase
MKITLLSVKISCLILFLGLSAYAEEANSYPAGDKRIVIMGRYQTDELGGVLFGASGVTFSLKFSGSFMDIVLEDEFRSGTDYNYFTVIFNDRQPVRFKTETGKTLYRIADELPPGEHTLILNKATEGQNGWNRLAEVRCEMLLQAPPIPERRIEYIGDSITCGFGANDSEIPCGTGTWFDQHDTWESYGAILSRRLNAQWHLNAVSGIGMIRNWNSPGPVMPERYAGIYLDYSDRDSHWDFTKYQPELVVIGLGTNDFSDGDGSVPRPPPDGPTFIEQYIRFIGYLRSQYPEAYFLLLSSPLLDPDRNSILESYLHRIVAHLIREGDHKVSRFSFSQRYTNGCGGHPDRSDHMKMADELEPFVRKLMGW